MVFSDIFPIKSPINFSLSHPLRGTDWNVDRQARLSTIYSTYCRLSKAQTLLETLDLCFPHQSYPTTYIASLLGFPLGPLLLFPPLGIFPGKEY